MVQRLVELPSLKAGQFDKALTEVFLGIDAEMHEGALQNHSCRHCFTDPGLKSIQAGATAVSCLFTKDKIIAVILI